MMKTGSSQGLSAIEVVIACVLVGVLILFLLMSMPKNREAARQATCQRNLMQIGMAVGLYHQVVGHLPSPQLDGDSPLFQMLAELAQPDFMSLNDPKSPPPKQKNPPGREQPVRGFVCPSDPSATDGTHPAPISYRANTGDTTDGRNGPFAMGRILTLADVEAGKGASFTAAFSERLVGTGRPNNLASYAWVKGPVADSGCPALDPAALRTDAGSNWLKASWVSTLYNHAAVPNASPSCIAIDGGTAMMGASSSHPMGVHVLLLDGSARSYRPSVALPIWKTLATTGDPLR